MTIKTLAQLQIARANLGPATAVADLDATLQARERQITKLVECLCTQVRRMDTHGLAVGSPMLILQNLAEEGLPCVPTWPRGLSGPTRALTPAEKKAKG